MRSRPWVWIAFSFGCILAGQIEYAAAGLVIANVYIAAGDWERD